MCKGDFDLKYCVTIHRNCVKHNSKPVHIIQRGLIFNTGSFLNDVLDAM